MWHGKYETTNEHVLVTLHFQIISVFSRFLRWILLFIRSLPLFNDKSSATKEDRDSMGSKSIEDLPDTLQDFVVDHISTNFWLCCYMPLPHATIPMCCLVQVSLLLRSCVSSDIADTTERSRI